MKMIFIFIIIIPNPMSSKKNIPASRFYRVKKNPWRPNQVPGMAFFILNLM
jgi:hypothetical protein